MVLRTQTVLLPSGGQILFGPGELLHVIAPSMAAVAATMNEAAKAVGLGLGYGSWSPQGDGTVMAQCWTLPPSPG